MCALSTFCCKKKEDICDLVLLLASHIEARLEEETTVVFIYLSVAYDTVWKKYYYLNQSTFVNVEKG